METKNASASTGEWGTLKGESTRVLPSVHIHRSFKDSGVLVKEEAESLPLIEARTYPDNVHLAKVSAGCRLTLNIGNYQSVQLSVDVTLPTVVEELEEAYSAARGFVDRKISEQKGLIQNFINSGK